MLRKTATVRGTAAFYEFVDPAFLNNKRPSVPGGAWPIDSLSKKSIGDLQQIWFQLVKEKNMLLSTKEHYVKHQEELGAMPAPSRIKMVQESMDNIKQVMRARDEEATLKATEIFRERLAKGVYRYPPGPQPPPGTGDVTSVVRLLLSKKISEDRIRDIFGKFDVYESHKGIAKIDMNLTPEAWEAKERAEAEWEQYRLNLSDNKEYHKWAAKESLYDHTDVELAPGVFEPVGVSSGEGGEPKQIIRAATIPPPEPLPLNRAPAGTLERLRFDSAPDIEKTTIQLGYYPNITMTPPSPLQERPTHPDEVEGPWEVLITYDKEDGVDYATSLNVTAIDGAQVISLAEHIRPPRPYAADCPVYQEVLKKEEASTNTLMNFPHVPQWKNHYRQWSRKKASEIVAYNYSNVFDYVDREVLLTGKSVWEIPVAVDYSCGNASSVPPHASPPQPKFPKVETYALGRNL